jgi:hypothetical protein
MGAGKKDEQHSRNKQRGQREEMTDRRKSSGS